MEKGVAVHKDPSAQLAFEGVVDSSAPECGTKMQIQFQRYEQLMQDDTDDYAAHLDTTRTYSAARKPKGRQSAPHPITPSAGMLLSPMVATHATG